MFHKRFKQMGVYLLVFCMMFTAVQFPSVYVMAAEAENIARSAVPTASSKEAESVRVENVVDGDKTSRSSRWGSNISDGPEWVQLAWNEQQTIQNIVIYWERKNIKNYKVQISDNGDDWETAQEIYSNANFPTVTTETITLEEAVTAKYIRVTIGTILNQGDDKSETAWKTASMYEIEVFSGEIPDDRSEAEKITAGISAPAVNSGDKKIAMPNVPSGVSVRFCADYEQVIGEDGTIYQPLETKTVKGFYEVTCPASESEEEGSVAKTEEYTITVPGQFTDGETANAKPAVIPELQEWHGTSGDFIVDSASRIIVGSSKLRDVAEKFAEDYKEIIGLDIEVVTGTKSDALEGDFYLALTTEKKGLDKEGYTIEIEQSVCIEAEQTVGAYWSTRTILQILKQTNGSIPKGMVRDYPKYEVRAFSLDVGRKPFTIEALYDFAKNMAWYKMNSFQVHLSDNLIFHEDYPTIEEAVEKSYAGFRLESGVQNPQQDNQTATSEDVYYTKDEFRAFIQDSRIIGVDIVPEFDMPAHALPFTRAFQQYMTKRAGGSHGYLIEEIDIANPKAREWAQDIWKDYFEGDNPVFDEDVTIHIGTDEYHGTDGQEGKELFRQFSDEMIAFVQESGRTVRMWGSLSNKSGTTPVRSEGVQLNIWNTGYANPQDMYNLGFDLINTLEGPNYIVPAAGYYNDYINAGHIYNTWQPNVIGNLTASAADDQILGACYAIWHDSVDTRANGISQYDSFDRFFKPLPAYAARLWGEAEDYMKGDSRDYSAFSHVSAKTGTAPGTDIYGETDYLTSTIASYNFDNTLTEDSSLNEYDLTETQKNVEQVTTEDGKGLKLKGGESYAETPLDLVGSNAVLTMTVKLDADASGEQILCESKDEFGTYGTYSFKAAQKNTGKVGFSREGYDYSFNYTLPKNQWVTLQFCSGKDSVDLYVNGERIDNKHYDENGDLAETTKGNGTVVISQNNNPDIYFANHPTTELSEKLSKEGIIKIATMMVPFGRIGSKTNSFKGEIESIAVTGTQELNRDSLKVSQSEMTVSACSQANESGNEGPARFAIDGNSATYWHSDWSSDTAINDEHHWFELTLENPTVIDTLTYLPRQDQANGRIYEYSIEIEKADGTKVTVADHESWADSSDLKEAKFDPVEAKKVKLKVHDAKGDGNGKHATIAEINLYKPLEYSALQLQTELDQMKAEYQKDDYTEISFKVLEEAFEKAEKILSYENSTQEDYFYARGLIQAAAEKLIPAGNVDKRTQLQKAVTSAREKLTLTDDYTEESLAELETAVNAAQAVLDDENASDDALAKALSDLRKVVLVPKEDAKDEEEKEKKKTELEKAVKAAEEQLENAADYTEESVNALQKAVADAKEVLGDKNATLEQLTTAMEALESVKLVKKEETDNEELEAKKKELQNAITTANNNLKNASKYTAASVEALKAAVSSAEALLKKDDITVKQLQDALAAITKVKLVPVQVTTKYYTVKFETLKGTVIAPKTVAAGKTVARPAAPKKAGYTFVDWYTSLSYKEVYKFGTPVTRDITLYAKWKIIDTKPAVPAKDKLYPYNDVLYKVTVSDAVNGTVTAYKLNNKKAKSIAIPAMVEIDGYRFKVTAVSPKAFEKASRLANVIIGENVESIGSKAFSNCKKLKNIKFNGTKAVKIAAKSLKGTAKNCKIILSKKMKKKDFNKMKTSLKKASISKKASIKKK